MKFVQKMKGSAARLLLAMAVMLSLPFAASAQTTGIDTADILAAVADAQTKGVAIAVAVTVMIFLFAAAKWIRRAK